MKIDNCFAEDYPEVQEITLKCENCGNEWHIPVYDGQDAETVLSARDIKEFFCECGGGEYK